MVELYTGALAVFGVTALLTSLFVLLTRTMTGSKTGGFLVLLSSFWSIAYIHQLIFLFSEDIILGFLLKSGISYIFPFIYVVYLHRFFEYKVPRYIPPLLVITPSFFAILQLIPAYRPVIFQELIIYNQNQVAPKYTLFGLTPILLTYLLSVILFGYFIKTLISEPGILKARALAFLAASSIFLITYTLDLFMIGGFRYEITPPILNILCVGITMFSTERLYKRDVLGTVFATMAEDIGDLIVVTDNQDRVIYVNDQAHNVSKLKAIKFLESHIWDVFPSLLVNEGQRTQTLAADGKTYDIKSYLLKDWQDYDRSKVYILRDVSELIEYQYNLEQLVEEKSHEVMQAERMVAIGETTLMVGHDLRNPLQVVKFLTHKLKLENTDPMADEILEKMDSNLNYMDKIVSDLSLYARNREPMVQTIPLIDLIENSLQKITVPENIILDYDFTFDFIVEVDPYMIDRVLNNLILNAIQAMPEGGVVSIEAEERNGRKVIRVRDSGSGIAEEIRENLFKPLNTTKPKGVGMGLAVCRKLVKLHKGSIDVDDSYYDGACFQLEFPVLDEFRD